MGLNGDRIHDTIWNLIRKFQCKNYIDTVKILTVYKFTGELSYSQNLGIDDLLKFRYNKD